MAKPKTGKQAVAAMRRIANAEQKRESKLRREIQAEVDKINKRLKRIQKQGLESPSADFITKAFGNAKGTGVSIKGLTGKQLLEAQKAFGDFLSKKTSSVTGIKTNIKKQAKALNIPVKKRKAQDLAKLVGLNFKLYNKVMQHLEHTFERAYEVSMGKEAQRFIARYIQNTDIEITEDTDLDSLAEMLSDLLDVFFGSPSRGVKGGGEDFFF